MKNLLIIFLICFCESVYGQGFPFVNPSTLTNAFIVAHHSAGTGGMRLDSLISPSDGNGRFSVANEGGAIVIATATYADDIVLTGDNGVTRLASDYDESFLFTLVNKNAIFLDSNTVYLGLAMLP